MRNRYIHSYETHRVDAVSEENGTKTLTIGRHKAEVHPECKFIVGDTLDIFTAKNIQLALQQ